VDLDHIYLARYFTLIATVSTICGSVLMFIVGARKAATAFSYFFGFAPEFKTILPEHLTADSAAMLMLIQAVDTFLFALVLLIFGFGVYQLFIAEEHIDEKSDYPKWRRIESVTQLKKILAEVVIVILIVVFLEKIITTTEFATDFASLTIPIAIFLFSAGLWLMRRD
jgi:uncharacterized membrane protein YqhA